MTNLFNIEKRLKEKKWETNRDQETARRLLKNLTLTYIYPERMSNVSESNDLVKNPVYKKLCRRYFQATEKKEYNLKNRISPYLSRIMNREMNERIYNLFLSHTVEEVLVLEERK